MTVNKITIGFVIQTFKTDTGECIGQEFIAGDEITYEDGYGEDLGTPVQEIPYIPFEMVQPDEM